MSGKRGSNPRPPAWKASALSTELFPQHQPPLQEVGGDGFEPPKSKDNRFTVCPIWPLWKPPLMFLASPKSEPLVGFVRDLIPRPDIEPRLPAWGAQSLSQWATREVLPSPGLTCFCVFLNPTQVFPLPGSLPSFSESGVPPLCPTGTQSLPSSLQSSP